MPHNEYLVDFLFGNKKKLPKFNKLKYFFIKFDNLEEEEVYLEIDELLKDLFKEYLCFFKKQNVYILIVSGKKDVYFSDVLKSIEGDFLIPTIGFESDYYHVDYNLPIYFQYDYQAFLEYKKNKNILLKKNDLIQGQILYTIDDNIKQELKKYVLKSYINDNEMLNVIKTYFKTNLNTTLAAKKCYMHRNTFINKIDKFIEVTQFNIRNYNEAFIVYLLIIS